MKIDQCVITYENPKIEHVTDDYHACNDVEALRWKGPGHDTASHCGVNMTLSASGSKLTIEVYAVEESPKRPEYVTREWTEDDGSRVTVEAPEFEFDERYFINEDRKIFEGTVMLNALRKPLKDYRELKDNAYINARDVRELEDADFSRAALHRSISDEIKDRFIKLGFTDVIDLREDFGEAIDDEFNEFDDAEDDYISTFTAHRSFAYFVLWLVEYDYIASQGRHHTAHLPSPDQS